jgi:hypothetical protein
MIASQTIELTSTMALVIAVTMNPVSTLFMSPSLPGAFWRDGTKAATSFVNRPAILLSSGELMRRRRDARQTKAPTHKSSSMSGSR